MTGPVAALPSSLSTGAASTALRAPANGSNCPARAVKAAAGKGSPGLRSKLQFLLDMAQATFSQPAPPTAQQIEALRRTLSRVPLEELGMELQQQQQEEGVGSASSSCSSSPGLSEGTRLMLDDDRRQQQQQQPPLQQQGQPPAAEVGSRLQQQRPPITYLLIYEDSRVSLGIFCLPARAKIPLHNHPGMTVLSRVLYGNMHVSSYDWLEPLPKAAAKTAANGHVGPVLPREARVVLDSTRTAADPPVVLFPEAGGNIHEFTAVTDCAVLDLMSPPYSTDDGRDCTYYTVVPGKRRKVGNEVVVLLDSFDPPTDFVINQGQYRGVALRPKLAPPSPSTSMYDRGSQLSLADSAGTMAAVSSLQEQQSEQPGSPMSAATGQVDSPAVGSRLGKSGSGSRGGSPLPHANPSDARGSRGGSPQPQHSPPAAAASASCHGKS